MTHDLAMVALGAVLGFLSGLFGVGGSAIATPLLRMMDVPRLSALATPLPVTLPAALVGGLTYWRRGLVNGRAALFAAAGGVPGVLAGAYLTDVVPGRVLMLLTGLLVVVVGVRLLWRPLPAEDAKAVVGRPVRLVAVGAGVGLLSGLLANGGGLLLVPAYLLVAGMGTQEAAATSLVTVALLGIPGTWVHWRLGHIDARLAALLMAGVTPSTYLGARVGLATHGRRARLLFAAFLITFGTFFLARTLWRAEVYGWSG